MEKQLLSCILNHISLIKKLIHKMAGKLSCFLMLKKHRTVYLKE